MSQESLNPEEYLHQQKNEEKLKPLYEKPEAKLMELFIECLPWLAEVGESIKDLPGAIETQSRANLAKLFIVLDPATNKPVFLKKEFEACWGHVLDIPDIENGNTNP